jgi:hypothetical protein
MGGVASLVEQRRGARGPHPNRIAPEVEERVLRDMLRRKGWTAGRERIGTLMAKMGSRRSTERPTPARRRQGTRSTPICCGTSPSTGPIRYGRRTSPTSRCAAASSIWWRSSTGSAARC